MKVKARSKLLRSFTQRTDLAQAKIKEAISQSHSVAVEFYTNNETTGVLVTFFIPVTKQ